MTAPALWKLEAAARLTHATPDEPDLIDGTDRSTPGMDDTDVEFPPRPPALRPGRSRFAETDPVCPRIIARSATGCPVSNALAAVSWLDGAQLATSGLAQGGAPLRLRI